MKLIEKVASQLCEIARHMAPMVWQLPNYCLNHFKVTRLHGMWCDLGASQCFSFSYHVTVEITSLKLRLTISHNISSIPHTPKTLPPLLCPWTSITVIYLSRGLNRNKLLLFLKKCLDYASHLNGTEPSKLNQRAKNFNFVF